MLRTIPFIKAADKPYSKRKTFPLQISPWLKVHSPLSLIFPLNPQKLQLFWGRRKLIFIDFWSFQVLASRDSRGKNERFNISLVFPQN
jgi:hypothetical protein